MGHSPPMGHDLVCGAELAGYPGQDDASDSGDESRADAPAQNVVAEDEIACADQGQDGEYDTVSLFHDRKFFFCLLGERFPFPFP